MRANHTHLIWIFLGVLPTYGQNSTEEVFVNQGSIVVSEGAIVATTYAFDNTEAGIVKTDGVIHFLNGFNNDNLYYHTKGSKSSMTYFSQQDGIQLLGGNKASEFYSIQFEKGNLNSGFDLKTEFDIAGEADFSNGIIDVDADTGLLTFLNGAGVKRVSDQSHARGYVQKIGKEPFVYPIGDGGFYRPASISAPPKEQDAYLGSYVYETGDFFKDRTAKSGVISGLNQREYWTINKSIPAAKGEILLTLSWDESTTQADLLNHATTDLHIVRWDEKLGLWVDEGGVVNLDKKEVTTATTVKGLGYFTLATVKKNLILDGDVVIYNSVTANGDGKNDYFVIDNINRYPNNRVEIFNRWGVKVFETSNYGSDNNVFTGYSSGRVNVKKGDKLPSGTYFYMITYDYPAEGGGNMIKKSGYLHLETD